MGVGREGVGHEGQGGDGTDGSLGKVEDENRFRCSARQPLSFIVSFFSHLLLAWSGLQDRAADADARPVTTRPLQAI